MLTILNQLADKAYDHSCMILCMVNKIVSKNVAQVLHANTVTTRSILLRIWFFVPHQETTDWKFERRVTNITWKGKSSFLQGKKSMMYDDHRLSLNSRCVRQKQYLRSFQYRVRRCFWRARHRKMKNHDWRKILLVAFGGNKIIGRLESRHGLVTRKPLR